jgi:hypothetical protein
MSNKSRYGSLRKYKKFNRERGDFHNISEQNFENILGRLNINFHRAGYPDYQILDNLGNIIGFVEVKPSIDSRLRPSQERFKSFCIKNNIPFFMWVHGTDLPFNIVDNKIVAL